MDAVYLGTHKTKISAYGGNVNTLFFSIKGMISEFVEQKNWFQKTTPRNFGTCII